MWIFAKQTVENILNNLCGFFKNRVTKFYYGTQLTAFSSLLADASIFASYTDCISFRKQNALKKLNWFQNLIKSISFDLYVSP